MSKYFIVKLEESSSIGTTFLNLEIGKTADRMHLYTLYYWKPTALGIALSAHSAQPPSVHRTWPAAMTNSVRELCTYERDARTSVETMLTMLARTDVPIVWPTTTSIIKSTPSPAQQILWCPMPYHIDVAKALNRALHDYLSMNGPLVQSVFGPHSAVKADTIRFAWRNSGTRLAFKLRALHTF